MRRRRRRGSTRAPSVRLAALIYVDECGINVFLSFFFLFQVSATTWRPYVCMRNCTARRRHAGRRRHASECGSGPECIPGVAHTSERRGDAPRRGGRRRRADGGLHSRNGELPLNREASALAWNPARASTLRGRGGRSASGGAEGAFRQQRERGVGLLPIGRRAIGLQGH